MLHSRDFSVKKSVFFDFLAKNRRFYRFFLCFFFSVPAENQFISDISAEKTDFFVFGLENVVVLYGKTLPPLWFLSARIWISSHTKGSLSTPHGLTKKKNSNNLKFENLKHFSCFFLKNNSLWTKMSFVVLCIYMYLKKEMLIFINKKKTMSFVLVFENCSYEQFFETQGT